MATELTPHLLHERQGPWKQAPLHEEAAEVLPCHCVPFNSQTAILTPLLVFTVSGLTSHLLHQCQGFWKQAPLHQEAARADKHADQQQPCTCLAWTQELKPHLLHERQGPWKQAPFHQEAAGACPVAARPLPLLLVMLTFALQLQGHEADAAPPA